MSGMVIIDWLITGVMDNPYMMIIGRVISMSAIIILFVSLLISSLKLQKYNSKQNK